MKLLTVTAQAVQHTLQQGSRAWQEHRFGCDNASDAAAMLNCDDNRSRNDLLEALFVGFQRDVGSFEQGIYDNGHRFEGLARPLAEKILGEDLYPLVLSRDWSEHGIRRPLGASLDGATLTRKKNWEHKQLNADFIEAMPYPGPEGVHLNDGTRLPKKVRVQMEQQFMVDDAEVCLFTASAWNQKDQLVEVRHCWYTPDAELRAEIVAGWVQAEADLATFQPRAAVAKVVADPVEDLPVLMVRLRGEVTESNLDAWRDAMVIRIKAINRELKTDEDFANAKAMVAKLEDGGKALLLLKEQALAQAADVLKLFQTIDTVKLSMDDTRKALDALVKERELSIRKEIMDEASKTLTRHIEQLSIRLSDLVPQKLYIMPEAHHPKIAADFAKAIKNKRTIKSLRDSVDAELARAKIAASALADGLEKNLKVLHANAEHRTLFADWRTLVFKEPDDCALVVRTRIADHLAEQERKTREAEEKRKREEAATREREEEAERQRQAQAATSAAPVSSPGMAAPQPWAWENGGGASGHEGDVLGARVVEPRPGIMRGEVITGASRPGYSVDYARRPDNIGPSDGARQVIPEVQRSGDMVRLGEIGERLGLGITQVRMQALGFQPAKTERNSVFYHREDLPAICDALIRHVAAVRNALHLQPLEKAVA